MFGAGSPLAVDSWWESWVSTNRTSAIVAAGVALNLFGGTIVSTAVTLVIVAVLLVRRRIWTAGFVAAASLASTGVVQLLKHLFGRERPADHLVAAAGGAFPSGHSASAALITTVLAVLIARRWAVVAAASYTLVMMLSRTVVNVHWATDTLGGALLGTGIALALWAAFSKRANDERRLNASSARVRHPHKVAT
ncbi:MAG: phosphatase PAP2 family protein [Pseudolysinimonas sp.]